MTDKQRALAIIENLPGNCSIDDVMYALYVHQKVERGLDDMKMGRVLTQNEMEAKLKNLRWG